MFPKPSPQLALDSCRQGSMAILSPGKLADRRKLATCAVLIFCPGGIERGGGLGRQMGYFLKEQEGNGLGAIYTVVDTRGPRFIGGSVLYTFLAVFYLALSLLRLLQARLFGSFGAAHINITARGSTIRKIIVAATAHGVGIPYLLHVHDYNYAGEYSRRGALSRFLIRQTFRRPSKIVVLGSRG